MKEIKVHKFYFHEFQHGNTSIEDGLDLVTDTYDSFIQELVQDGWEFVEVGLPIFHHNDSQVEAYAFVITRRTEMGEALYGQRPTS